MAEPLDLDIVRFTWTTDPATTVIALIAEVERLRAEVKQAKAAAWDEGYYDCAKYLSDCDEWDAEYDDSLVVDDSIEGFRDDNPPKPKRPSNPYVEAES